MGFERALNNFDAWCDAERHAAAPSRPTPAGPSSRPSRRRRTSPATGERRPAGHLGLGLLLGGVGPVLRRTAWQYLARGIADLRRGDPTVTFLLADCLRRPRRERRLRHPLRREQRGQLRRLGLPDGGADPRPAERVAGQVPAVRGAARDRACSTAPSGRPRRTPTRSVRPTGAPPIVVVGTTGDPATPYESTAKLADMLGTGQVLTWEGEGHTAYPETDLHPRGRRRLLHRPDRAGRGDPLSCTLTWPGRLHADLGATCWSAHQHDHAQDHSNDDNGTTTQHLPRLHSAHPANGSRRRARFDAGVVFPVLGVLPARLHPRRLARHLRVLGRVGHVAQPVALVALGPLQQRRDVVGDVVDGRVRVADLRRTAPGTVARVKSFGSTSGSSSQVTGVEAVARGLARSE